MIKRTRTEVLQAMLDGLQREYQIEVALASVYRMGSRTGRDGKPEPMLIRETDPEKLARAGRMLEPRIERVMRLLLDAGKGRLRIPGGRP